jgi:hypothetical protein
MTSAVSQSSVFGPNGDCPSTSITALSTSPSTVTSAITGMAAVGGTNITEGAAWGWRVLSPGDPFSSSDYDEATSKVLIIMTDGENTIYPLSGETSDNSHNINHAQYYSAYGFPTDYRLLPSSTSSTDLSDASKLEGAMNTKLSTICTNAKTLKITIYTIGVDVDDTSDVTGNKKLLTDCATKPENAHFPNTADDLKDTFASIANELAALRLAE